MPDEVVNNEPSVEIIEDKKKDFLIGEHVLICKVGHWNGLDYDKSFFEQAVKDWEKDQLPIYPEHADADDYTKPKRVGNVDIAGMPKPLPIGFVEGLSFDGENLYAEKVYITDDNARNLIKSNFKMGYSIYWDFRDGEKEITAVNGDACKLMSVSLTLTPAVEETKQEAPVQAQTQTEIKPEPVSTLTINPIPEVTLSSENKTETMISALSVEPQNTETVVAVNSTKEDIDALRKELSEKTERLSALEKEVSTLKEQVRALKKQKYSDLVKRKLGKDMDITLPEEELDKQIASLENLPDRQVMKTGRVIWETPASNNTIIAEKVRKILKENNLIN